MKAGAIAVSLALHGLALAAAVRWKTAHSAWPAAGSGEGPELAALVLDAPDDEPPPAPQLNAPDAALAVPPLIVSTGDFTPPALIVPEPSHPRPLTKESARANGSRPAARGGAAGGSAGLSGVFSPPQYRHCPAPPYPAAARAQRLSGEVLLRVAVLENGAVESVALRRSSGHALLDEAALRAVRGWRFAPAHRGERAVPATVEVPVRFALTS